MSSCLLLKSSSLALGIGTIAQVPVPEALTTYREYGVIYTSQNNQMVKARLDCFRP